MLAESLRNCSRNPRGNLDVASGGVGLRIAGWALDPDTNDAIDAHVYIDGTFAGAVHADGPRADIAAAFPGVGPLHGFDEAFAIGAGAHQVCVFALNVGYGLTNPLLGCRGVAVSGVPAGSLDVVSGGLSSVTAAGWAIDPDTVGTVDVHVPRRGHRDRCSTRRGFRVAVRRGARVPRDGRGPERRRASDVRVRDQRARDFGHELGARLS
jgi:hypothetical protein